MEAKLQAVSSKNIYSEQGLEPLILSSLAQVFQALIVSSNCKPGSAQPHALLPIKDHKYLESKTLQTLPSVLLVKLNFSSFLTQFKK